jgi:hypothetical protein
MEACPSVYTVLRDFALPLVAVFWAVWSWYLDNHRVLSIRQVGDSFSDRIAGAPDSLTTFSIEVAITNDSPRANIVIAYYDLELPWKDVDFHPLLDPRDFDPPSELYWIHPESIQIPRDKVLNHRRYQNGKLGPGEAFRGYFLAKGGSPIPEDLRKTEAIEVQFVVEDTRGKQYRSGPLFFHYHGC